MKDVTTTARLARLELTGEEAMRMQRELGSFLEFMKVLTPIETEESVALELECPLREDIPVCSTARDELLSNAGGHDGVYFTVPKAVEQ